MAAPVAARSAGTAAARRRSTSRSRRCWRGRGRVRPGADRPGERRPRRLPDLKRPGARLLNQAIALRAPSHTAHDGTDDAPGQRHRGDRPRPTGPPAVATGDLNPVGGPVGLAVAAQADAAGWSSSVARWAHNPEVAGSNPAPATSKSAGQRWSPDDGGHLSTLMRPAAPPCRPGTRGRAVGGSEAHTTARVAMQDRTTSGAHTPTPITYKSAVHWRCGSPHRRTKRSRHGGRSRVASSRAGDSRDLIMRGGRIASLRAAAGIVRRLTPHPAVPSTIRGAPSSQERVSILTP